MTSDRLCPTSRRELWSLVLTIGLLWSPMACAQPEANDAAAPTEAVRGLLAFQQDAWNRADIDAFMQGYWHDEALRFAGGDTVRTGWQDTLDRYRKSYPDAAAMGQLGFDLVEVRQMAPDVVYVFGKWVLTRPQDAAGHAPHGLFTLIVEKKEGRWVITRDHTSAARE